jgi:perosamine synthetase
MVNPKDGLWRVGVDETKFAARAIKKGLRGELTKEFEEKFAKKFKNKYAIACNSGTSALHASMYALGIRKGDEVIVPSLTFVATSFAPLYVGAKTVFVDVDPDTWLICPDDIEKKITKRTKAIITVSLYGASPDYDKLNKIKRKYKLKILEDNAQSVLGTYKNKLIGTIGDMSIFSLQRSKHLTTGDGGVIVTNNKELAEKARKFADLGYARLGADSKATQVSKEDIQDPSYLRHELIGLNLRMPEVIAAMGIAQINKVDSLVKKRVFIANLYHEKVKDCEWLIPQKIQKNTTSSYWTYVMSINNCNKNVNWHKFKQKFIEMGGHSFYGAWAVNYKEPAFIKYYKKKKLKLPSTPNAERLQPTLIQLKTNFQTKKEALIQASALEKTIKFFDEL